MHSIASQSAFRSSPDTRRRRETNIMLLWLAVLAVAFTWLAPAAAQTFPRVRLDRVNPPGAKAGTTVEVVLDGNYLDEVKELYFSDSRIKAEFVPPPKPDPKKKKQPPPGPPKFKITVPANVPLGVYDVRAIGKWGISNPRAFAVSDLNEIMEKESNNDVPQAQAVELNTIVNGNIGGDTDVDYCVFTGKKGQRVVIYCAGSEIDSRLDPQIEVYTKEGSQLVYNRQYFDRNAVVDCILPDDGEYYIRLSQFAYLYGGDDSFYRLKVTTAPWIDSVYPPALQAGKTTPVTIYGRNLPGGKLDPKLTFENRPLETFTTKITPPMKPMQEGIIDYHGMLFPASVALPGFEYRLKNGSGSSNPALLTYTDVPVHLDNKKNNASGQAQEITLPCTICGQIEESEDEDWYAFTAKKGDVYTLEGFGARLGIPMNFFIQIRRIDGEDNPLVETFDQNPDFPIDNNDRFTIYTEDPRGRFVIPADGEYRVMISTQTALTNYGPRFVYQVNIRKEEPDFRLMLVGNETANIGGFTIHKGGAQELNVVVIRRDNFDGEVLLEAEGLPNGITCRPQVMGPRIKRGVLVLEAAPNAPEWAGEIKFKATAVVDGKKVVRPVQAGCLVWTSPNNVPNISRLCRSICMAVRDKGPFVLETDVKEMEVPVGGKAELKVQVKRQWKDFKAQVQLVRIAAPVISNGNFINLPNTNVAPNKSDATIKFTLPSNTIPGTYNLVVQGRGKFSFQPDPKNKKKQNVDVYEPTPPVKIVVYDKVAELSVANPKLEVKAGEMVDVAVNLKRLHSYDGEFELQLIPAKGFGGISASKVKVGKGANQGKLTIKTAKNAKIGSSSNFKIRATARVNNVTFTHDVEFQLTITKAASTSVPSVLLETAPVAVAETQSERG